jgi:hypothetical protein
MSASAGALATRRATRGDERAGGGSAAGEAAGPVVQSRRMDPERFRFRDDVLRAAASRTRRRLLVSFAAAAAATAALWGGVLRERGARPASLAFALALLTLLAFLSLRRRLGRLHARWSSFEVRVEADGISRVVSGFPPIRIARAELAGVEERAEGVVVRDRSGRSLLVPRELEGYERVRGLVSAWRTA